MNKFNFREVLLRVKQTDIALPLANIAKNDFLNNFKTESFAGSKWKTPQRKISGTNSYKYPKTKGLSRRTKPILIGSGRLRRDVSNSVSTGMKNNKLSYTLVVQNPYAEYHNDGNGKIPQRKFVGTTPELNKKLLTRVMQEFDKVW